MVNRFFKQADGVWVKAFQRQQSSGGLAIGGFGKYRFRGHAQKDFWRWVCSWARAVRYPSDLGFQNDGFVLPELRIVQHIVKAVTPREDFLFDMPAVTLQEQRAERRRTMTERCEQAAQLVANTGKASVSWCHLIEEGRLLEKMIPGAVEVEGEDSDEFKEETFEAFARGEITHLISKPTIAGFGLNWQHCARQIFVGQSWSMERQYQAMRRSYRFGQDKPVHIHFITPSTLGDVRVRVREKFAAHETMKIEMKEAAQQLT